MFQCYSLKSSHPCLLPLSPKVCSLHLCIFCCPERGIVGCYSSVSQSCQLFVTHGPQHARLPCPSLLPKFAQTHVHWISDAINHLILCCPLLFLPSVFPSIRFFSSEYWNFNISTNPSNQYSRLIFFRIDWFDLAFQGTLKSLLQHHISKASILQCSAFFFFLSNCHTHTWWLEKP